MDKGNILQTISVYVNEKKTSATFGEILSVLMRKYQIINEWMCNRVFKIISESDMPNLKHLFKISFHEQKKLIHF